MRLNTRPSIVNGVGSLLRRGLIGTPKSGLKWLCEGRAGGPQGSALTCVTFPMLLDVVLKGVEAKFPDVEAKAIQDDIDLYGNPADILGDDGALQFILLELK